MDKQIIEPVDVELILGELTAERFLRRTNKADNEIYVLNAHNSPHTMREIGRLREIAFRAAGGGTGKEIDVDEFDTMEVPCEQLIVWNPEAREIIGGYRYIIGGDMKYDSEGQPLIASSHLFRFSDKFIKEYLPNVLELGRSFVRLEYQSSVAGRKSLYALDNLWDGLGALTVLHPEIKYFFGKVTMYPSFGTKGRDMILFFLKNHFGDKESLVVPHKALRFGSNLNILQRMFPYLAIKDNYKVLNHEVRQMGQNIPPLVNAYMNLSSTMKVFGTAINDEFGDVEETGILVTVEDIYSEKRARHIDTYTEELKNQFMFKRFGIS